MDDMCNHVIECNACGAQLGNNDGKGAERWNRRAAPSVSEQPAELTKEQVAAFLDSDPFPPRQPAAPSEDKPVDATMSADDRTTAYHQGYQAGIELGKAMAADEPAAQSDSKDAEELRRTLVAITPERMKEPHPFDQSMDDEHERIESRAVVRGWNACLDEVRDRAQKAYDAALAQQTGKERP